MAQARDSDKALAITDRVVHRFFGTGTVVELKVAGHYARVVFQNLGRTLWVAGDELSVVTPGELYSNAHARPRDLDPDEVRVNKHGAVRYTPRRRLIEALRLGIVPEAFVSEFTFGRDLARELVMEKVTEGVAEGRGRAFIVEDDYGKGKTHYLMYLRAEALKLGFAVSFVSFDPEEVTPFRVKRVYAEAVASLRWIRDGSLLGFRDLMLSPQSHLASPHPYLSPFFALRDRRRLKEHHWQWIQGDRNLQRRFVHLPSLLEDYVAANLYCNLLGAYSSLLGRQGVRGWLLLFDEAESLDSLRQASWRRKGANFLRGLVMTATSQTSESGEPDLTSRRIYGQDVWTSPANGLLYSRRRRPVLPYRFQAEGADPEPMLFPAFAFTPVSSRYHEELLHWVPGDHLIGLEDLGRLDYHRLLKVLLKAYEEVYGFSIEPADVSVVFESLIDRFGYHIRSWVKGAVEVLDILRLTAHRSPARLLSEL